MLLKLLLFCNAPSKKSKEKNNNKRQIIYRFAEMEILLDILFLRFPCARMLPLLLLLLVFVGRWRRILIALKWCWHFPYFMYKKTNFNKNHNLIKQNFKSIEEKIFRSLTYTMLIVDKFYQFPWIQLAIRFYQFYCRCRERTVMTGTTVVIVM